MDLLDRVYPPARDLLGRVDASLMASGAPDDHPIWPLLRRLGALPGELVGELASVASEPLSATAGPLRGRADGYAGGLGSVPAVAAWRGPAAEGFAAQWSTLGGYLAGDEDTMAGRLVDTARYLDDVAAWLIRARREVAGAVAVCLGSAEAATLSGAPSASPRDAVLAAATIGAHILEAVAEVVDDGQRTLDAWAGRLDELPYRPSPSTAATVVGRLEIG
jgi:hypothetical protein